MDYSNDNYTQEHDSMTASAPKATATQEYKVSITVPIDDDSDKTYTYRFRRPSVPSYDRYVKTMTKAGITRASKAFLLDCVVEDDRQRLEADMEETPGVAITIGNKLTDLLGLVDNVNLKKL